MTEPENGAPEPPEKPPWQRSSPSRSRLPPPPWSNLPDDRRTWPIARAFGGFFLPLPAFPAFVALTAEGSGPITAVIFAFPVTAVVAFACVLLMLSELPSLRDVGYGALICGITFAIISAIGTIILFPICLALESSL